MKRLLSRSPRLLFAALLTLAGATACTTDAGGSADGIGGADATGGTFSALHCTGAEGDKAVAPDNPVGISLPPQRVCLNVTLASFLAAAKGDVQPSAMVKDSAGNAYFTGMTKGFLDTTYGDLFVAKVSPSGTLTWFMTYGGAKKDAFPLTGVHDPSDGVEGMLAIDDADKLYVVGNRNATEGFIVKLDADGTALWAKGVAKQAFQSVSVASGTVHVAGDGGIFALDAATGDNLGQLGLKLKSGAASRMFAVKATAAGAIYLGGWAGFSGDDDATLFKLSHDATTKAYTVVWDKRIPAPKGSKISSIDVAADASIYVGLNTTGATDVRVEVLKFGADGTMTWARRYGDTLQSKTDVVKVIGTQVVVGGNTLATGTATFSDGKNGDGMLLLINADGSLAKEHYFFTGTNPASYDSVRDVEVKDGKLYVITDHFGVANFGEWRDPNEYGEGKLKHAWKTVAVSDYLLQATDLEQGTLPEMQDVSSLKDFDAKWSDLTANAPLKPAAAGVGSGHNAAVFSIIDAYIPAK